MERVDEPPAVQQFDAERADAYEDRIRRLAPGYDVLHGTVESVLATCLRKDAHLLVVGAGTGAEIVRMGQAHPRWRFTAVDPERLAEAFRRVHQTDTALPETQAPETNAFRYDDLFFYEDGRRPRFIRIRDIVFIEAVGNYTELHLMDRSTALPSTTLSEWDTRLPDAHFVRIHRSTMVHVEHVTRIESTDGRAYNVHVDSRDAPLSMSRRRARVLKDRLP